MKKCPLFNTHHAPVGAWSSLTFGAPNVGVSVDVQDPGVKNSGILLAGVAGPAGLRTIGFVDMPRGDALAQTAEGTDPKTERLITMYGLVPEKDICRTLTPSKDIYQTDNVRFTVYTPYDAIPDPKKETIPAIACLPGILLEVTVDNTAGTEPCTAYFGFKLHDTKKTYSYEDGDLLCIRHMNSWTFAAKKSDGVFMTRGGAAMDALRQGRSTVHQNGPAFFALPVPAGKKKTLTLCWSVYAKEGSNGARTTTYYYNRYFHDLMDGARAVLDAADAIRATARKVDTELLSPEQEPQRVALFSQAVRGYYASSQLLEDGDGIHWNLCEGAYMWRNTMDLCADHILWELRRNPWVVRSIMEDFLNDYSYTDTVTYPGMEGEFPGGISFTHDMGCFFTYSHKGCSGYERVNDSPNGFYFYMTTEELLGGIYCIAGYVLATGDTQWLERHPGLLSRLMESLENRDGPTPETRNGILKATTTRGGKCALESTTYDNLDHSLLDASGNLYVFIKGWCCLRLLEKAAAMAGEPSVADRAAGMIQKCKESVGAFCSDTYPWLKANAYKDISGAVSAAVEPLAVLDKLEVLDEEKDAMLLDILRRHSIECLRDGVCRDSTTGGLRLSSSSNRTWVSKSVLALYVMEKVLGVQLPEGMVRQTINWGLISARELTVGDQVFSDTAKLGGAPYYPRIVTAAVWL